MSRSDLLNATSELEKLRGVHGNHTMNSRRKHMSVSYLAEATDEALAAYLTHLENVIKAGVAEQMIADALVGVELPDDAKKRLLKRINA